MGTRWGLRARVQGGPGEPALLSASPQTARASSLRRHAATYRARILQPILFLALPGDLQIRPAFDLWSFHNPCAEDSLRVAQQASRCPSSSLANCGVLDALSPICALCKTNEKVTGASLRELFSGTSKPVDLEYLPVPSVLLDAVPRAHSRNLPSLSFKPSASAHSGPDTRRRREEQRNAERAVVPRGLPRWKLCACQNQGDASKEVRLLSLEPGLAGNLWDPPPGAQCLSVNSLLQGTQGQLQLSAFLFANLPAGRLQ